MATAKKTPSGNYRCLAYIGKDESGKRKYKSFTAPTKREAERLAANYERNHAEAPAEHKFTLGAAVDQYISNKENILSLSTIREYRRIRKKDFTEWYDKDVYALTASDLQSMVNELAAEQSPKTVRNRFMLISASIREVRPDFSPRILFPQKQKKEITIPSTTEVMKLLEAADGTPLYVPIVLAAFAGMRRGEICALEEKPKSTQIKINKVMVLTDTGTWQIQNHAKTEAGNRTAHLPQTFVDKFKDQPFDVKNPNCITDTFVNLANRCGLKMRFHDLRHFYASLLMSEGLPDKYVMERIGHSTDTMLKSVYQHTMAEKQKKYDDMLDNVVMQLENATFPRNPA